MTNYLLFTADTSFDLAPTPRGGGQSIRKTKKMQNKPNFMRFYAKNSDPHKKQTQSKPIQSQFYPQKPPPNQKQTQTNPIKPNCAGDKNVTQACEFSPPTAEIAASNTRKIAYNLRRNNFLSKSHRPHTVPCLSCTHPGRPPTPGKQGTYHKASVSPAQIPASSCCPQVSLSASPKYCPDAIWAQQKNHSRMRPRYAPQQYIRCTAYRKYISYAYPPHSTTVSNRNPVYLFSPTRIRTIYRTAGTKILHTPPLLSKSPQLHPSQHRFQRT